MATFAAAQYTVWKPGKILGLQHLATDRDSIRNNALHLQVDVWGSGGWLDAKPLMTVVGDEITLDADATGWSPEGYRLQLDASDDEWIDTPFNDGAGTISIGATYAEVPISTEIGTDGLPHYGFVVEVVGEILAAPDLVVEFGDGLRFTVTGQLRTGEQWTTSTEPRPCWVWFESPNGDPATSGSEGMPVLAEIVEAAGVYTITIAHTMGQADPDLTEARYKILKLGPSFATAGETAAMLVDHILLGEIVAGMFDDTNAVIINAVGPFIGAFNVEHYTPSGLHRDIHADSIQVEGTAGEKLRVTGVNAADDDAQPYIVVESGEVPGATTVRLGATDLEAKVAGRSRQASEDDASPIFEAQRASGTVLWRVLANADGGTMQFPAAVTKAQLRVEGDTTTNLWVTNDGGAGTSAIVHHDGILEWRAAKAADAALDWALQVNTGSAETLFVRNIGAGIANLDVDGDITGALDISATDDLIAGGDIVTAAGTLSGGDLNTPNGTLDALGHLIVVDVEAGWYSYDAAQEFVVDVAPFNGGWAQVTNPGTAWLTSNGAGTPPYVQNDTTAAALVIRRSLDELLHDNQGQAVTTRISSIVVRYLEDSGSLVVSLRRALRDGSGGVDVVDTAGAPVTSGSFSTFEVLGATRTLDEDYGYWIEANLDPTSTASDVRIANVLVTYDKTAVE